MHAYGLLAATLAAAICSCSAQDLFTRGTIEKDILTKPTIGTNKPTVDIITKFPTIGIAKCGVVADKGTILGYSTDNRAAVYQNKCSGVCPSRVDVSGGESQQYQCKPNLYGSALAAATLVRPHTHTCVRVTAFHRRLAADPLAPRTGTAR